MIIEARGDVVTLRGNLTRNQWLNIKAAANHLLREHPHGIIIDCGHVESVTEEGIDTFVDARRDIEARGARIMLADVPPYVLEAMRGVPGASSQLPVARNVEEARSSLLLTYGKTPQIANGQIAVLVPLFGPGDAEVGVRLGSRIAARGRAVLHLLYVVPVPRALPLGTPLGESGATAQSELSAGEAIARQANLVAVRHIQQTRSLSEAILQSARSVPADVIAIGLRDLAEREELGWEEMVLTLLRQAPCEVIIARGAREQERS
jgi:anti-anti-sigma regulatory factor/nucleotide-binding universal stress UspA family protein